MSRLLIVSLLLQITTTNLNPDSTNTTDNETASTTGTTLRVSSILSSIMINSNSTKLISLVDTYLGWPLEIECKLTGSEEILWSRRDSSGTSIPLGLDPQNDFYSVQKNFLFVPVSRRLYENNTIFECKAKDSLRQIKVVVHDCDSRNPCENGGKCVFVNENSKIPIVTCECKDGYQGKLCETNETNTPSWILMSFGGFITICLIIIAVLILKKRKKDDIVRKINTFQQQSSRTSKSAVNSKVA